MELYSVTGSYFVIVDNDGTLNNFGNKIEILADSVPRATETPRSTKLFKKYLSVQDL